MHIFFATPSYNGITHSPFLDSFQATIEACKEKGWDTTFSIRKGNCYVQVARNSLIKEFLDSGADVLFFLDDDISWPPGKAIELIEMRDEIVAGVYPMKAPQPDFPVVIHTDARGYPYVRSDGCISATSVPTGFLCIKRSVIKKLADAYPQQRYVEYDRGGEEIGEFYDLFPQGVYDGRWVGEDYAFCRLWTRIMGQIWVVPDIDFTHAGYEGNYHRFLMAQPKE